MNPSRRNTRQRLFAVVISCLITLLPSAAWADTYTWFGAASTQTDQSTGVRETISQPAIQTDAITRWWWPGITLNNGDFLQGGYVDPSGSACGLQWFYWAFNSMGTPVQQQYGPCGLTGGHEFRIAYEGPSGGYYKFVFRMDGVYLRQTLSAASWAYSNYLTAITEMFSSGTYTSPPFLPSVTFSPSIQFYNCASVCGWGNVSHARVLRQSVSPCPTMYVVKSTGVSVRTYYATSGTCLADHAPLW